MRDWLAENASFDWKSICPSRETSQPYFRLTEHLFDGIYESSELCVERPKDSALNRNLIIREQLLIANELKAEDEADLNNENEAVRQAALKKVTGLVLNGRDLRYANFSGSRLPKVDFIGASSEYSNLRYTNFKDALLINARMIETELQGADLSRAQLHGAFLSEANLQEANLDNANFQGATCGGDSDGLYGACFK